MNVRVVVFSSRSEDFCRSLCSGCSHECSEVWVAVADFSAVDFVYIKSYACVVS